MITTKLCTAQHNDPSRSQKATHLCYKNIYKTIVNLYGILICQLDHHGCCDSFGQIISHNMFGGIAHFRKRPNSRCLLFTNVYGSVMADLIPHHYTK